MSTLESRTRAWSRAELAALARSSHHTIVSLQSPSGAYPASPTFSAYLGYSWFRDGAFIADAVSSYGNVTSASRFFDWCARVLRDRREQIAGIIAAQASGTPVSDRQMLPTRYTLDGQLGDDEWWDFQLDGYGTWLWAVVEHAQRHDLELDPWSGAMRLSVDYLLSSWQRPCYDWWEERPGDTHVSTLGCIAAGLAAAVRAGVLGEQATKRSQQAVDQILALVKGQGVVEGHLVKTLGAGEMDASLLSLVSPLRVFPSSDPVGCATLEEIDRQLNVDGGVHRFLADTYFGGGQWPLLSCFLGLALLDAGDERRALEQLQWSASTATAAHQIPEQVDDHLLDPRRRQEWIDRWGTPATPLLWSHAMFIRLAVALSVVEVRA
jgi:GH15 family glucan-1,4-alpha-glucosidase